MRRRAAHSCRLGLEIVECVGRDGVELGVDKRSVRNVDHAMPVGWLHNVISRLDGEFRIDNKVR